MGRRHVAAVAAALAAALCAQALAGAGGFRVLAVGHTEGSGQSPHAYLATSARGVWLRRLSPADRATVGATDFVRREAVAVFLDGAICGSDPAVRSIARGGRRLRIVVAYTKPPIGIATCVRLDTPYIVITVPRTPPLPTTVQAVVRARA